MDKMMQKIMMTICLCALSLAIVQFRSNATDWTAGTGNWNDSGNWSGGQPGGFPNYNAYINNGGTAQITDPGEKATTLKLGESIGESGNIDMTGGDLTIQFSEYVGESGTGVFTQSGGTHSASSLYLGKLSDGDGTYNLSSIGNLETVFDEYIGDSGIGTFTQSGGINDVGSTLYLGRSSGGVGTYNLNNGDLSSLTINIGASGTGVFTQSGGTNSTSGFSIGSGAYNLIDGSLSTGVVGTEYIGKTGTGTFTQSSGTNSTATLNLGQNTGSGGTYNLNGGTLTIGFGGITSGDGSSRLNYNGGTLNVGGDISVDRFDMGSSNGSNVSHTISAGRTISSEIQYVGLSGDAHVTQDNGDNAVTYDFKVGHNSTSTGIYDLNGGTLSANSETLGFKGNATFNQAGGTNTIGSNLYLGTFSGTAEYNLTGGTLDVGGDIRNGGGTSTLTIAGGSLVMSGSGSIDVDTFIYGSAAANGNHTLNSGESLSAVNEEIVRGGFKQADGTNTVANNLSIDSSWDASYYLNGGTLDVGGNIVVVSGDGPSSGLTRIYIDGGTLNMSSGGSIDVGTFNVGYSGGSTGSYTLSSGESLNSQDDETIGHAGTGTFIQSGGTNTVTADLRIGRGSGSSGTYTQSGGTNSVTDDLVIGWASGSSGAYELSASGDLSANNEFLHGNATFTQSGGTNTVSDRLGVGYNNGSNSAYNLSSGNLSANREYIGFFSGTTGTFTQSGGTNTVTNALTIASFSGSTGTYNLEGGTLTAGDVVNKDTFNYSGGTLNTDVANYSDFNLSGTGTRTVNGTFTNNGTVNVTNTTVEYTGIFSNRGAYISDPSDNSFTDISITATGYLVGGTGDNFFVSGDFISSSTQSTLWNTTGAFLGFTGTGTHDFYLTGSDFGALTSGILDNYAWGTLSMASGIELSLIDGNSDAGGALYLSVLDLADDVSQINSIFSNFNIYYDSTASGNSYLGGLTYGLNGSGFLTPYSSSSTESVPEPATIALLGIGLAGFAGVAIRRRLKKVKH